MPLKGADKHLRRMQNLYSPRAIRNFGRALLGGADLIKAEAKHLITEGSISGAGHVPSKPGEPPNADTRDLDTKIEAVLREPLVAEVSSNSDHAAAMEFGTSKVEARPYMVPARDKRRAEAAALLQAAVDHTAKTGG